MDHIYALSVGQRFIEYCEAGRQAAGKQADVHSVFDKAVNLRANGEILAVVSEGTGRSSSGLMIDSVGRLKLSRGETCYLQPDRVCFRDLVVDFSRAGIWRGRIDELYRRKLSSECLGVLKSALDRRASAQSVWFMDPDTRLKSGVRSLADDPAGAVRGLIGLGRGLTPSGDDVLLGFLAVLNHYSDENSFLRTFRGAVNEALRSTVDLSAQLLKNALRYEYHEYVEDVAAALCGIPEALGPAVARLLGVGATSGSDIISGMYYAAELIVKNNGSDYSLK